DTTTTFAGSLAAFYNEISIGHVEAGLRTWNKYSPFPEEMNRQMTGIMADLHFAPTEQAEKNLLNENKDPQSVVVTGNTAIDAMHTSIDQDYQSDIIQRHQDKRIMLITSHRRENIGQSLENIFKVARII
ncbi:UDP-N-acetylglucosamine 2-epimerase (non-hydrolyzing), partial [Staphylococcus arlettae]|uniref:UDP-N-acetylglucosamine 2-epimerase n=1 Tax=Staphylococcus arlettae TaxID=29378 RepID=UPI000D4D6710